LLCCSVRSPSSPAPKPHRGRASPSKTLISPRARRAIVSKWRTSRCDLQGFTPGEPRPRVCTSRVPAGPRPEASKAPT
jgi:hypothetical protein